MSCNDAKVKIRRGQLMLTGYASTQYLPEYRAHVPVHLSPEMESFFKPSLDSIVSAIQRQRQTASRPISVGHERSTAHPVLTNVNFLIGM